MKKSILNLEGVEKLSKAEQKKVKGEAGGPYYLCFPDGSCPDGLRCYYTKQFPHGVCL